MRVFWHQGPQEDRKSTEETEAKQINLRWEFFDTKAHKKTERAQKRQGQSKIVFCHQGPQEDRKSTEETETKQINLRWEVFLTPRATRRQKEHRRDRNNANQFQMGGFLTQGPQEDRKSTEKTETKQINLRWGFSWHQGLQEYRQSTEETETKQFNLRWEFFDTKAHKKTERAQKRQKQIKSI